MVVLRSSNIEKVYQITRFLVRGEVNPRRNSWTIESFISRS